MEVIDCAAGALLRALPGHPGVVVLHRDTGAVLGTVPLPGVPDVVMHDPARTPSASIRTATSSTRSSRPAPARQFT